MMFDIWNILILNFFPVLSRRRVRLYTGRMQHSLHSHRHCWRPELHWRGQEQEGRKEDVRHRSRQGPPERRLFSWLVDWVCPLYVFIVAKFYCDMLLIPLFAPRDVLWVLVLQIHHIMGGIQRRKKFHRGDVHLKRRWNGKRGRKMWVFAFYI